jgi:7-carboxy-7-deazaguanine synthase (Cx14CxxC type)
MTYSVKEIFYSLQGEGYHTGRPAVFCRFTGCNLWSGREEDRSKAVCQFCDTDFVGADAGKFDSPQALVQQIAENWPSTEPPFVICTGGEPLLQLDTPLIKAFHQARFEIAIETNGTIATPPNIDWICVSPKANAPLVLTSGDELKLVYPQAEATPEMFEQLDFKYFYLQPMDNFKRRFNTELAIAYCLTHPQWRLSVQTHKGLGIR